MNLTDASLQGLERVAQSVLLAAAKTRGLSCHFFHRDETDENIYDSFDDNNSWDSVPYEEDRKVVAGSIFDTSIDEFPGVGNPYLDGENYLYDVKKHTKGVLVKVYIDNDTFYNFTIENVSVGKVNKTIFIHELNPIG